MDYEGLQTLYDRIILGQTIITYNEVVYIVKDPKSLERQLAFQYYSKILSFLEKNGVPTTYEKDATLQERKVWLPDDENKLKELDKEKKELLREVTRYEFQSLKKKACLLRTNEIDNSIKRLQSRKSALSHTTSEYIATLEKNKYFIYLLTHNIFNERVWTHWESFCKEDDIIINHLISESYFNKNIDEAKIRLLARSEPWRSTWITGIKTGNLFNGPVSEMTDLQRLLVSWSIIYDGVYESMECPSDDVIQNDALLDHWLNTQNDKRKKAKTKSSVDDMLNDKDKQAGEVGIMVDSLEDAQRVFALNDPIVQEQLRQRSKHLRDKGIVKEGEMPDTKRELQMARNRMEAEKHKGS